jgi:ribosomal protein L11 methyltransferase
MKYHCLHITTDFAEDWQKDLFEQQLFDLGVDSIDGDRYYIPSDLLEEKRPEIIQFLSTFNFQFSIEECQDENWNAVWESEHPMQELPLGVKIIPHCAFGAGHHETTSMMIENIINYQLPITNYQSFRVLDHGTGTGVLAIFAKRLGAANAVAVDIDEKSVENAKENAALNGVDIDVRLAHEGETLSSFHFSPFDLILANIHRNVLLANMHAYSTHLNPDGELWMSGFYDADCPILQRAAEKEGMQVIEVLAKGEWRLMKCRKQPTSPYKLQNTFA